MTGGSDETCPPKPGPSHLQMSVTSDGWHVTLTGDLDLASARDLAVALKPASMVSGRVMTVDLAGLTFCDCAGIGALIEQHNRLHVAGSALMIVNPARSFRRLLELTELDALDVRPAC